jgi:hypothetical protein
LINGSTINGKLRASCHSGWLGNGWTDRKIVEEIYLRALTRLPDAEERAEWEPLLSTSANKTEAVEDLLWTVLNSREFAFNH